VRAAYEYIAVTGVPLNETILVYGPGQVRETIFHDPSGIEPDVTIIEVGIPGSREQETVAAARTALEPDLAALESVEGLDFVGLTGAPFLRERTLDATTSALLISLPIAAVGVFLLLLLAMRSVRYALVTIVPIGLVSAWLYAIMYLTGFSLNFVTATIGAISIGVGIDYSIHMTERFREELARVGDRMQALRRAANGTGTALIGSAASSIIGFGIMGLAPMPLFASYGILTAIMIFLAIAASLVVLPSLLLLATPEESRALDRTPAHGGSTRTV
jgi:predicted RND superfamily exporter protein